MELVEINVKIQIQEKILTLLSVIVNSHWNEMG